ncbi:MAG: hypothetical protein WB762_32035 [Candidatus Sulfotelmatobacter sp.]
MLAIRPVLLAAVALIAATGSGQILKPNQTYGFGGRKLWLFTDAQNFESIDQPHDQLNFNGITRPNHSYVVIKRI